MTNELFKKTFPTTAMKVEVLFPQGILLITKLVLGKEYKHRYIGYSKAEAKKKFTAFVKEQRSNKNNPFEL